MPHVTTAAVKAPAVQPGAVAGGTTSEPLAVHQRAARSEPNPCLAITVPVDEVGGTKGTLAKAEEGAGEFEDGDEVVEELGRM